MSKFSKAQDIDQSITEMEKTITQQEQKIHDYLLQLAQLA